MVGFFEDGNGRLGFIKGAQIFDSQKDPAARSFLRYVTPRHATSRHVTSRRTALDMGLSTSWHAFMCYTYWATFLATFVALKSPDEVKTVYLLEKGCNIPRTFLIYLRHAF